MAELTDTTAADFAAGSGTCTVASQLGNGEVLLHPALSDDFSGTSLSSNWTTSSWGAGGAASVAGGSLSVDGASVASTASYSAGTAVDFTATFQAVPFQHAGFAGSDQPFNNSPWAIFSTGTSGTSLQARAWNGGSFLDYTVPGSWLGAPHHYRIEWTANAINFLIDGALVHSEPVAITATMQVGASDFTTGGASVSLDWVRVSSYDSPCTFTSRVLNAGGPASWSTASGRPICRSARA